MRLLFSSDPMNPRLPDTAYAEGGAAGERLGIGVSLVRFEALVDEGDAEGAVRRVAPVHPDEYLRHRVEVQLGAGGSYKLLPSRHMGQGQDEGST